MNKELIILNILINMRINIGKTKLNILSISNPLLRRIKEQIRKFDAKGRKHV